MGKQITEDDLIAELMQAMAEVDKKQVTRLPGDLDYRQLEAAMGLEHARTREKMKKLVEAGKYKKLWVWDENGKKVMVFRKII